MNVIISNKYQSMLQTLEIEVIKEMNGVFEVEEIVSTFQNFFYSRLILDITALKDYKEVKTLQKLSIGLDMDKIILLLDDSPESRSTEYLSKLISMGIYNFSKNTEDIKYQLDNPNTYRDVAHIHQLENIAAEGPQIAPTTPGLTPRGNEQAAVQQIAVRVLGFKNLTKQAGSTTFIYLAKKVLQQKYRVTAVEVDKRDFMYFNDKDLVSTTNNDVATVIGKHSNSEVILVDINNSASAEMLVGETIFLMEPSTLQINRAMVIEGKLIQSLKNKKIVLNKSFLSDKEVSEFSYESKLKIFFNIPSVNDRATEQNEIRNFLIALGFNRFSTSEEGATKKGGGLLSFLNVKKQ